MSIFPIIQQLSVLAADLHPHAQTQKYVRSALHRNPETYMHKINSTCIGHIIICIGPNLKNCYVIPIVLQ